MIDLERVRADTPGIGAGHHLDNAGSSLPPAVVLDTVIAHLRREAEVGGYRAEAERAEDLDAVYGAVAALVGVGPEDVAVVENASRAWDAVVHGIRWAPGQRVVIDRATYISSALSLLQLQRRYGVEVVVARDDEHGQLDVEALGAVLDERVVLVALTHVPTFNGLVNPVEAAGRVIAAHSDALYLLDACQSVGQRVVDVGTIGCHFLSATGRKFVRAPRGTGFLVATAAARERHEPLTADLRGADWVAPGEYRLRDDARRYESWERSMAAMLGLGAAARYATGLGLGAIEHAVTARSGRLRECLSALPGVHVHDRGEQRSGIVTFAVDGVAAMDAKAALTAAGVQVSVTLRSSGQLGFPAGAPDELVRASPHYYNDDADLDALVGVVADLARRRTTAAGRTSAEP